VPTADRQKATVKVRIAFESLDPRVLPDMGVKVAFLGDEAAEGTATRLVVPRKAVRKDGKDEWVFVVADGKVEKRAVRMGATIHEDGEVLEGLKEGERVVVEGPADLAEGRRVRAKS
jgi:multidrug efflux pump subunit AcrA (membrane-fusion protein)